MKYINETHIRFPGKSINEGFARSVVSAFVMELDPTISELADIKTAVSEAVTNSIVHGYRREVGVVYIDAYITADRLVIIRIRDKGVGIKDVKEAMRPLFTTAKEEERAGLGFAVMQSFMDKVKVRSDLGKGTTVTLEKLIVPTR